MKESALTTQNKTNRFVSVEHVEKLLRNINSKKSSGIHKIPPKLVQLTADISSTPLTNASIIGCQTETCKWC